MLHDSLPRLAALTAALALLVSSAFAQVDRIGTIDGTVDGVPTTWHLLALPTDEGPQSMVTHTELGPGFLLISLQAFAEERFMIEGTLTIDVTLVADPSSCPCVVDDADVLLFTSSSMFNQVYMSDEAPAYATVTITRFEPIREGVYALEGTVDAYLTFAESAFGERDESRAVRVEASFVTESVEDELDW